MTKPQIPIIKTGDAVTILIFKVPVMENEGAFIKMKMSIAKNAGKKTYHVDGSRFNQFEQGKITEGIFKGSYRIVVPPGEDNQRYIDVAKQSILNNITALVAKIERLKASLDETTENIDFLPIKIINRID